MAIAAFPAQAVSENICKALDQAIVRMKAQNNFRHNTTQRVANDCGKKKRRNSAGHRRGER